MKEIKLTQGKFAIVDNEDYEYLNQFKWYAYKHRNTFYAKYKSIRMHRLILNIPQGLYVDHINHNGLDNRKENLRICTNQQNLHNSLKSYNNKSGFKGVFPLIIKHKSKIYYYWRVEISCNNKKYYLGTYKTKEIAALAYNEAAIKFHGEFACLNIIEGL
jgi:hypothetical protein